MDLQSLIQTVPNWESKSAQEIADELNAASVEVRDDQLYTWAGVALLVGPDHAEALRLGLDANGVGWAVHQLGGSGIQLSNPLTQQMLDALIADGLEFCGTLKLQGIQFVSRYRRAGGEGFVSDSDVSVSKAKQLLLDDAANKYILFREAITNWDGTGEAPAL